MILLRRIYGGDLLTIHPANIVNMVTIKGITFIQLGNMDNIMGILE